MKVMVFAAATAVSLMCVAEDEVQEIASPVKVAFEPMVEAQLYKMSVVGSGFCDDKVADAPEIDLEGVWEMIPEGAEFRVRADGIMACGSGVAHTVRRFRRVAALSSAAPAKPKVKPDRVDPRMAPDWNVRKWTFTNKVPSDRVLYRVGDRVKTILELRDETGAFVNDTNITVCIDSYRSHEGTNSLHVANGRPIEFDLTMDRPGLAVCRARVIFTGWDRGAGLLHRKEVSANGARTNLVALASDVGVLFDVERIAPGKPLSHRPAGSAKTRKDELGAAFDPTNAVPYVEDIDEYWNRLLAEDSARAARGGWKVKSMELKNTTGSGVKVYLARLESLGGDAYCHISIPPGAEKGRKYPIWAIFQAYGHASHFTYPWEWAITIAPCAHSFEQFQKPEYYREQMKTLGMYGFAYGKTSLKNDNNDDPDTCYFRDMLLRDVRAIRYMMTRPEWDGEHVMFYGSSQGGYQSMAVASLIPETTYVNANCPWLGDLGGSRWHGFRPAYRYGIAFCDPVNLVHRIRAKSVLVHQGTVDMTCSADGVASMMNLIPAATKCTFRFFQSKGHAVPETLVGEYGTVERTDGKVTRVDWDYAPKARN